MSKLDELCRELQDGKIGRRTFVKKCLKLGLSATTVLALGMNFARWTETEALAANDRTLRIISAGIAIQEPQLKKFTEMTGIKVEGTPATLFGMMSKWVTGGSKVYDIIDDNSSYLPVLWSSGTLKPIPADAIPNRKYLFELWTDPKAAGNWQGWPLSQVYTDDTQKYFKCVPRFMNFEAFGYNTDAVPSDVNSYGALLDPKYAGKTAVWNDYTWTMSWVATYLNSIGIISVDDPSDLDRKSVDKCMAYLTEKKKAGQFRAFWDDFGQIVNLMVSGEVVIADCWNPVIEAIKASNVKAKYVNPKEGNRPWFHSVAMSKYTKKEDLVYEYANWSLEGWFAASVAPIGWYGTTKKVKDYLTKDKYDFWYAGKGRDTGSFIERAKNIACYPHWPKENDYYMSSWMKFLAA